MALTEETLTHRLILPREANHHGTLYAGSLVSLALEAAYATGFRAIGDSANLVLKRVLDLRCIEPVPIGEVVQIRGVVLLKRTAQIVVGLYGSPLKGREKPWMDALMQFVQIDEHSKPKPIEPEMAVSEILLEQAPWDELSSRLQQCMAVRGRNSGASK